MNGKLFATIVCVLFLVVLALVGVGGMTAPDSAPDPAFWGSLSLLYGYAALSLYAVAWGLSRGA